MASAISRLAHDDMVCAIMLEMLDLGVGMRPGNHRDARIDLLGLFDDLPGFEGIRRRHQQPTGMRKIGLRK